MNYSSCLPTLGSEFPCKSTEKLGKIRKSQVGISHQDSGGQLGREEAAPAPAPARLIPSPPSMALRSNPDHALYYTKLGTDFALKAGGSKCSQLEHWNRMKAIIEEEGGRDYKGTY